MKGQAADTEVHEKVRRKYAEISCSIKERFKYPTGREGALSLGYDLPVIESIHSDIIESFCGVGNPFSQGPVNPGETLLDVGCGGGFDLIIAGCSAGPEGRLYGIDLVPQMVEKARKNIMSMELTNTEIRLAGSESIPFGNDTFDIIISNGAIYLSPLKEKTYREIHRVLKPGGRLQFADASLKDDLPEKVVSLFNGWTG